MNEIKMIDFSDTELNMADKIQDFVNICTPMQLLDLYVNIFGEDELTNQLRKEIAGEEG